MHIAIINYPYALQSAVFGLYELFEMANSQCQSATLFKCTILTLDQLNDSQHFEVIILPPSLKDDFYLNPSHELLDWLRQQHAHQATLCSACSGAFILAKAGVLEGRQTTTHWALAGEFQSRFAHIPLDTQQILINQGNIITAGGVMSWLDLGLELVAQHAGVSVMTQLGKNLVVDTGHRSQKYYQQFIPKRNHGDHSIVAAQLFIDEHYSEKIKMPILANLCHMSERSFLRRFVQATGFKPSEYLQRLRIQKACEQLEQTQKSFEAIAIEVGYEDSSACRKIFVRIITLTPKQFRQRFAKQISNTRRRDIK